MISMRKRKIIFTFKQYKTQENGQGTFKKKNNTKLNHRIKNRRCGMIAREIAIHQLEIKLVQVSIRSSIMTQSPVYNGSCKRRETILKTRQST